MFDKMNVYPNFTEAYVDLLKQVYLTPEYESEPRGMRVKEKIGCTFKITNICDRLPYVPHREFSITYCIAEMLWYLSGNNSTEWISNYASFWRSISDDGLTANSAYGSRIFKQHKYQCFGSEPSSDWNQWDYVKDELRRDPDSRRAVIHIRMPQDSYMASKDVPCTLSLQFFIRNDELHQVVSMRSSDLILGIAYDVPAFTLMQELLALELGVRPGSYTHISNSLHIYERHYGMVEKIINDPTFVGKLANESALPMKQMTTFPNLPLMNLFEEKMRASSNVQDLFNVIDDLEASGLESYWRDWLYVLAYHRAGKLGSTKLQSYFINRSSFVGFSLFNK